MHKHHRIDLGLFISKEILKQAGLDAEKIELEVSDNEIRIHPLKKRR